MNEQVNVLLPPTFKKSGTIKPLQQAWLDGDWIGTFNLWIVRSKPYLSIVYQIRSKKSSWAPGQLDVTAGGHYSAGETVRDGLREVEEELGKKYTFKSLTCLGKRLSVTLDRHGNTRNNLVDIFMIKDDSPLSTYTLEKNEVRAICICPIYELLQVHTNPKLSFKVKGLTSNGSKIDLTIRKQSFPYNWDNYHLKMAILAQKFLAGEKILVY